MKNLQGMILEGLSKSRVDEHKGVKANVRNKKEALMVIELFMKEFNISVEDIKSVVSESVEDKVGQSCKLGLSYIGGNGGSLDLSDISLHNGWGEKEIKNSIENCARTPESIASVLNSSDWIVGKDWKKGAGSNDKSIKLVGSDSFGNKMRLTIKF